MGLLSWNPVGSPLNPQGYTPHSDEEDYSIDAAAGAEPPPSQYGAEADTEGALPIRGNFGKGAAPMPLQSSVDGEAVSPHVLGQERKSFGQKLVSMLPWLGVAGAGILGAKGIGAGDAIGALMGGFANQKLKTNMDERKRKNEYDDWKIQQAHKVVERLSGADLSGLKGVPEHVKGRLTELHKKYNEFLMNDKIISPNEAAELLAIAGPIETEMASAKSQQSTPEAQARAAEQGRYATAGAQAEQLSRMAGVPLQESEEGDRLQGTSPEQDAAFAQKKQNQLYQADVDSRTAQTVMTKYGPVSLPAKEAARYAQTEKGQEDKLQMHEQGIKTRLASIAASNGRFQQRLQRMDEFAKDKYISDIISRASTSLAIAGVMPGSPNYQAKLDAALEGALSAADSRGVQPGFQGGGGQPPTKPPSASGARKVVRGPDGKLTFATSGPVQYGKPSGRPSASAPGK